MGGVQVRRVRTAVADDTVDAVVFDAPTVVVPYEGDLAPLVSGALGEAARVAGRCVLVADRDWREAATGAGWTVDATSTPSTSLAGPARPRSLANLTFTFSGQVLSFVWV